MPRLLPPRVSLVKANSRVTLCGLLATGVAAPIGAGLRRARIKRHQGALAEAMEGFGVAEAAAAHGAAGAGDCARCPTPTSARATGPPGASARLWRR
ncbi:hypothetical protein STENM327S_00516 [Streptomyces tendae]